MENEDLLRAFTHVTHRIVLDGKPREAVLALLADVLNYPLPGTPEGPIAPLKAVVGKPKIALCLGHARAGDEGAVSVDDTSEEEYNLGVMERVASALRARGYEVMTITYYEGSGYTAAMTWLARTLLARGAALAIEFHFNASSGQARGHEFLHWAESRRGVTLARSLSAAFTAAFPERPSRGLKPKSPKDRGALFLSLTHCPAVIAEPFFGDNREEWHLFSTDEGVDRLVAAYVAGITTWLEGQA